MQTICWRHFALQLPSEWELLSFTKDDQLGRCTFADRYQHRLQFIWSVVENTPNRKRLLADYLKAAEAQLEGGEAPLRVRRGVWDGVVARIGDVLSSRFWGYFPGERCLIELVFLWPKTRDAQLEQAILRSVQETPVDADGFRRWRAFGMDMRVPTEYRLERCVVRPGYALLEFVDPKQARSRVQFERIGMVQRWLTLPLAKWLSERIPKTVAARASATVNEAGHTVESVVGVLPRWNYERLLGRAAPYWACATICPDDGRLYCQMITGKLLKAPTSRPRLLTCCPGREHEA